MQRVSVLDSGVFSVALGNVPGLVSGYKFGRNSDLDSATVPETIWNGGGLYTGQPLYTGNAETVEVFSDNVADTLAGTGARELRIFGLDDNLDEIDEVIEMDGVTPVVSVNLYRRLSRAIVESAGTAETNLGTITIRHTTTTANVFARLPAEVGQTLIAAYTVPAGKRLLLQKFWASISRPNATAGSAVVTLRVRPQGGAWNSKIYDDITTSYSVNHLFDNPPVFEALTDIRVDVISVSANDIRASTLFEYTLEG